MTSIANLQIKVDSAEVESATKRLHDLKTATSEVAKAEEKVRRPRKSDEQDIARLLGQIDRQTKNLARLESQQRQLNAAHAEGKVSQQVLEKYNAILQHNISLESQRGTAQRAALAEQQRVDKLRYESTLRRYADEAKLAEANAAAVLATQRQALIEQQAIDKIRYNNTLRRYQEELVAANQASKAKEAAERAAQEQALTEQQRMDKIRLEGVLRRFHEEAQLAESNARAQQAAQAAIAAEQQAMDKIRYESTLRRYRDEQVAAESAAKARAAAERAILEEAAAEQQRLDKIRYESTLRRYHQEQEAAEQAAKAKVAAEKAAIAEQESIDKIRYESTLRRFRDEATAAENAAKEKAAAQIKAEKDAAREQERLDKERYDSTLRRFQAEIDAEEASIKAKQKKQQEIKNLVGALDPYAREMIRISEIEQKLNQHKSAFSPEQFDKYTQRIGEARKEAARYKDTLDKTGLSAKQLRMAQQGLPAQFTDIVVSLQGGQAPLTVLLQQGGQMKDMFGGIKPMLKGVGDAVWAMVNPWTVMGATIAATAAIWWKGAGQLAEFNKAIISSGNAAGTTAGQMRLMAEANAGGIGTIRENAEALTLLAQNGKLLPETYQEVANAAASMATASGAAVKDLVEDFTSLGKDPVESAVKLNDKYGFLTASVYRQARALEEQGKQQEAIKLLTGELAEVMEQRAEKMKKSARGVAAAWHAVTKAIGDAIDRAAARLNPTFETDLGDVNEKIDYWQRVYGGETDSLKNKGFYKELIAQRNELVQTIYEQREAAAKEGETTRQNRLEIQLENDANRKRIAMLTAVQKAQLDLDKFNEQVKTVPNMKPEDVAKARKVWQDALDKAKKDAQDKLDAKTPKSAVLDTTDANEIGNRINEIKSQYKAMGEAITQQQNAGTLSSEAAVAKRKQLLEEEASKVKATYEEQIAALEKLKNAKNISKNQSISIDKQIADARSKMVVAQQDTGRKLDKLAGDEQKRLRKQQEAIDSYSQSLDRMLKNLKVAGERERAGLSMSSGERELNDKLNSEDDRYSSEVFSLNKQKLENPQNADVYDQQLRDAANNHTAMKKQIVDNYEQMKVAQQDWAAGVSSAYKQYAEDGQNYAAMTKEVFTNAFNGMEDALVSFVTTGKASFSDLTRSILADMARMAVRIAASRALTAIIGMFAGPSAPAAASMGSATSYDMGMAAAKGAAFDKGTQYFAKGGAFTNSIVSKPTSFSTNKSSNNVMGEAGPEAIMPLTRASDGSLGVRASVDVSGLQQGGGSGVQVWINIDGQGQQQSNASDPGYSNFGNEIGQFVDQRYKQLLAKDLQPGGDIWKSQQR